MFPRNILWVEALGLSLVFQRNTLCCEFAQIIPSGTNVNLRNYATLKLFLRNKVRTFILSIRSLTGHCVCRILVRAWAHYCINRDQREEIYFNAPMAEKKGWHCLVQFKVSRAN